MTGSILNRAPLRGFWSVTAHPVALELAASLNPDYICVDLQHGTDWASVSANTFTALNRYGVASFVRVPSNHHADIGRALDLGADGVVVPMVNSEADAVAAAESCRYPAAGIRSFGMQTPRVPAGENRAACAVQIETVEALDSVEAIAHVDGVDILYVGPADLGLSLVGQATYDVVAIMEGDDEVAQTMASAFDRVVSAAKAAGKIAGLHCGLGSGGRLAEERGFGFSSIATDVSSMRRDMFQQLSTVRAGGSPTA